MKLFNTFGKKSVINKDKLKNIIPNRNNKNVIYKKNEFLFVNSL
jgi:hypothetical protein